MFDKWTSELMNKGNTNNGLKKSADLSAKNLLLKCSPFLAL